MMKQLSHELILTLFISCLDPFANAQSGESEIILEKI